MFVRSYFRELAILSLGVALTGCANPSGLDSVQVSPPSQSLPVGQTTQLSASGTFGNANHQSTQDVTQTVTWTSSVPAVATVVASGKSGGLVTAVGAGTTTITANATAYNGPASSSATITVTSSGATTTGGAVASIAVIPGTQAVSAPLQTSQFIAIGTTTSGATLNLTNQVQWSSSSQTIATIGATTGLATAVGKGTVTITAIYNGTGGTVVTGTGTFTVSGGTTQQYTALTITPTSQALSASGQTSGFVALGTSGTTGYEVNVSGSSQIHWSSSNPSVASVDASSGTVTALSSGATTITALLTNPDGSVVSNTAAVTVSITATPEPLLSLTIIPSSITVGNLQDTGQFLAIGTFSTPPYVRDLTNSPSLTWLSATPEMFPVNTNSGGNSGASAGLVTAYGAGTAVIIAEATSSDGTIQTATATFTCPVPTNPIQPGQCYPGSQASSLLATVTVYNEGLNTTNWQVTANSATALQPDPNYPNDAVLHCGPGWTGAGGSVCTATYPLGTTLVLRAAGGSFGGWSYNCTPSDSTGNPLPTNSTLSQSGPNYCAITISPANANEPINSNVTVGAIFN